MANILYGVSGEGSGHSSRAKVIISYLQSRGHKVKVISYGKGYENLSPVFDTERIFGLRFFYKDNEVRYLKTVFNNYLKIPSAANSVKKVVKIIKDFRPRLVISDFEPISCIAANIKKIPLISIDNQHCLTNTKIEYPRKYKKEALAAKAVISLMTLQPKAFLLADFYYDKIIKKNTFAFPPILRDEVLRAETSVKDYILVYLTSDFKQIIDILRQINKKFIVYGFDKNEQRDNITFKTASQDGFLRDLADCEGVIANAGLTLITEALYLKKPYLAWPIKGQFEQIINGYHLEKTGYGKYWDELDKERIESFLFNLDLYRKNLEKHKKEDNSKIFLKLDQLIKLYANQNRPE